MTTTRCPSDESGFTLLEVLVALVITGLLVAILMSSLYYMFRAQDKVSQEIAGREADLRVKAWVIDALEHCLPRERRLYADFTFTGSAKEIRCETTAAIGPHTQTIPLLITLSLSTGEKSGTRLTYKEQGSTESQPITLTVWPEGEAKFTFHDADGQPMDQWPPEKPDAPALPSLITLLIKQPDATLAWLAAPRADGWVPPPPTNPFGIKIPGT